MRDEPERENDRKPHRLDKSDLSFPSVGRYWTKLTLVIETAIKTESMLYLTQKHLKDTMDCL